METRDLLKKYVEQLLYRRVFMNLNLYVLLVVVFLSFEKLLTDYQVL